MMKKPAFKTCDVYSYGILLWELATHDQPFKDLASVFLIPHEVLSGKVRMYIQSCTFLWKLKSTINPISSNLSLYVQTLYTYITMKKPYDFLPL